MLSLIHTVLSSYLYYVPELVSSEVGTPMQFIKMFYQKGEILTFLKSVTSFFYSPLMINNYFQGLSRLHFELHVVESKRFSLTFL
jgi:hypothetical protein